VVGINARSDALQAALNGGVLVWVWNATASLNASLNAF
jgi:hypothetical protein